MRTQRDQDTSQTAASEARTGKRKSKPSMPERAPVAGKPLSEVSAEFSGSGAFEAEAADIEANELYEMVNIYPADSGLPMTVWAGPRGNARHDVRIKVNMAHGNQMSISNTAVVALRPTPRLIAGRLSSADLQAVSEWLRLNEAALVAHWDGQISGVELGRRLQRLP